MAYLLDANVVSELRKAAPHPRVTQWHASHSHADVHLSAPVTRNVADVVRTGVPLIKPFD